MGVVDRGSRPSCTTSPMSSSNRKPAGWLLLACASALLILSACGSSSSDSTPTLSVDAIYTAAVQTFEAQAATQLALTPPTDTPSPTLSATLPPPSAAPGPGLNPVGQSACDNATYLSDVTVPDGTVIAAGAKFVKTWLIQNTGTCAWSTSYKLSFDSGDQMGGTDVVLASPIQAGQQVAISVNLVAPAAPGTYKGTWRMHNDKGQAFGDFPYVEISVGAAPTACHRASKTTVTISGHAGPENTTIDYGVGTTVTDANGDYSFTVPVGWSGTVTPWKAKVHPWTFNPQHKTYTNLTCDLPHEDYKATPPPGV
jgi:hypothetical protein